MRTERFEENKTNRELIRETAREVGDVVMSDLAEDLLRQGLWDDCSRLTRRQFKLIKKGAYSEVKDALKSEKMNNHERAWYALEEGAKARWGYWRHMTKRESRGAYALLHKKAKEANREVKQYRRMHIERFKEDPHDFLKE